MIKKYWWIIAAGMIMTGFVVKAAYAQRGCFAIGGEFLITPFLVISRMLCEQIGDEIGKWF